MVLPSSPAPADSSHDESIINPVGSGPEPIGLRAPRDPVLWIRDFFFIPDTNGSKFWMTYIDPGSADGRDRYDDMVTAMVASGIEPIGDWRRADTDRDFPNVYTLRTFVGSETRGYVVCERQRLGYAMVYQFEKR
jgi:hypothetical protein